MDDIMAHNNNPSMLQVYTVVWILPNISTPNPFYIEHGDSVLSATCFKQPFCSSSDVELFQH